MLKTQETKCQNKWYGKHLPNPFIRSTQESPLGPILFNLSINDYSFSLKKLNFADNNTIYVSSKDLTELLETLQKECETSINWLKTNNMIVNPDKFQ